MTVDKKLFLGFLTLIFLSFFTFLPSFSLALFGDDWLTLYRYFQHLGSQSSGEWNHFSYFFTSYGPQDILMGLLQKLYGYQSTYYYLTSYISRVLAAFSLIPLVFCLTKSKTATLFSIGFFLITSTGIETTNWVFNMPSYIAIAFMNLFFYYYFISRFDNHKLVLASIFFYLSLVSQPIRMHGLLPIVFLMEILWVIQNKKMFILKKAILRVLIFVVIFIFVIFTGLERSLVAAPGNLINQIETGWSQYLRDGRFDLLFNPLIILGNTIIPSDIAMVIYHPLANILFFMVGSLLLIYGSILLIRFFKEHISTALFLSLSLSLFAFLLAWLREPYSIFSTSHRYLIVSGVGISIFLSVLITIQKRSKSKLILYLIFFLFVLHVFSTRDYLNKAVRTHDQSISNKIWSSFPYIPEIGKLDERIIFYFEGDGSNEAIIHDVITYGFSPHMSILYNRGDKDEKIPTAITEWAEVISAAKYGKTVRNYGFTGNPLNPNYLYAFHLAGRDRLIDITELARTKLKESLEK